MDVKEKLVELSDIQVLQREIECVKRKSYTNCTDCFNCDLLMTDERILSAYANAIDALQNANGATVQECGEWVHPKGYVVSNGFLCSKCGHEEASYYPINPRSGGVCIADENGNFYYPPKLNYCPNCGAKMMP